MPVSAPRPRRIVTRALGLGLSALVAAGALAWTAPETSGWSRSYAEGTLWQLMNGARANNGLAPLQSHGTLVGIARWRSQDMLDRNYFSHTIPGCGCLVYVYYTNNGIAYDWAGENIAWNSGRTDDYSPVRAHEQFMGSPGHRANVLDPRFTHGGVGAAAADDQEYLGYVQDTRMYTQLFLQPKSAPPPPAPAPAPAPASGGSSGGGSAAQPAPAAPAAPAAAPARPPKPPKPKPRYVKMDVPSRPTSRAGLDGVATRISRPAFAADLMAHHLAPERAAARAADLVVTRTPQLAQAIEQQPTGAAGAEPLDVRVTAADAPEPGLLETLVGAIVGFLFG